MPKGTRVSNLVEKLVSQGTPKDVAIAIAQSSTKQSYATGKPLKGKGKGKSKKAAVAKKKK